MQDEVDAQWFSLCAVLEYYDTLGNLAVRDSLFGGDAQSLILQADLASRAEMLRVNGPTLPYRQGVLYLLRA